MGMHEGSVLSPFLFAVVVDVCLLSRSSLLHPLSARYKQYKRYHTFSNINYLYRFFIFEKI